jgi:hyperosmotically inducible protein
LESGRSLNRLAVDNDERVVMKYNARFLLDRVLAIGLEIIFVLGLTIVALPVWAQQRQVSQQAVERIQKEVRHELIMLPYVTIFDNLGYKVDGYNVTLMGQVTKPSLKSDAESAVKRIEGVEKVVNQIEVLPLSPMDDRLRQSLYRAIYAYPPLQRYGMPVVKPIRIIVKNGHVTLIGVVDSVGDKNLAGLRANTAPGVFSVKNDLVVVK